MMKLTERQKQVRSAIEAFMADHGYPPSIRELASQFSMA
ncbi:MAG: repressor LexA, partial [bacterium]|nr:repressor LexA [bacterium]